MATNQEALHASICAFLGTTPGTWESDWHALWDSAGIPVGPYNGRMLAWLNQQMGTAFTNLPGAQAAFATSMGYYNWSSIGSITNAAATSYFTRSGTLTPGRKALINTLLAGITADLGVATFAAAFDAFWLLANETSTAAYKNIAKDDHHCTVVGTVTFTADQGMAGNGTTGYLATDYIPSTDVVAAALNAVHVSVYDRTNRTDAASVHAISARNNASAQELGVAPRFTSALTIRMNDSGAGVANTTAQGYYLGNRSAADAVQKYRNAVAQAPVTTASVGLPTVQMFIGARNIDGVAGAFTTDQIALATVGKSLSAANVTSLTNRVEAYMDAIGAGII